jgi:hypothetical protein
MTPRFRNCEAVLPSGKTCPRSNTCLRYIIPPRISDPRRIKPKEVCDKYVALKEDNEL